MIEMLGVLAIVGVLSVAGIAGYSKAMEKYKIEKARDQMQEIAVNLMTTFQSQSTYKDLTTAMAKSLGAIPDSMIKSGSVINAFGGSVDIAPVSYDGVENAAFTIKFGGLPQKAAIALGADSSNETNNNLLYVQLGHN